MAGDIIDEAYVEIKPDVDNFSRKAKAELTASFKDIERKLDDVVDSIEHGFDRLLIDLDAHFDTLADSFDRSMNSVERDSRHAAEAIATDFEVSTKIAKHSIDDLADNADRDFRRMRRNSNDTGEEIGKGFLAGIGSALSNLGSTLQGGLGNIGSMFGGGGDIVGALKIAAIAAAVPVVISLGAALSQLLGFLALIPAIGGVAIGTIAPLMIAFQGLGDAVGAGLSGDMEKFQEALKGLPPTMQAVVKEIVGLKTQFTAIKKSVQNAFFAPLIGEIKALGGTLFPALNRGLTFAASALGNMGKQFLQLLGSDDIIDTIEDAFASVGKIINAVGPSVINFIGTLFGVMEHGLPFVEKLAKGFATALDKFSAFLSKAISGDKFTTWVEDALRVAGELWDLLKELGGLVKVLFTGAGDSGEDFIQSITQAVKELKEFFESTKGQETLKVFRQIVIMLGHAFIYVAEAIAGLFELANDIAHGITAAWDWVISIPDKIKSAWNSVTDFFSGLWNSIKNFFSSGVTSVQTNVSTFVENVKTTISNLPEIIWRYITDGINKIAYGIGAITAMIYTTIRDLPTNVANKFEEMKTWLFTKTSELIEGVTTFFSTLPSRIGGWIDSAKNWVVNTATSMKNEVVSKVSELVSSAVAKAKELPGKIKDGLSSLVGNVAQIGRDMINGMINGIKDGVGRLVQAAKDAVSSAWQGAKDWLASHSPSKKWAELGRASMAGYDVGAQDEMHDVKSNIVKTVRMPYDMFARQGANSPTMTSSTTGGGGGPNIVAYLQIGDDQLHPVVVKAMYDNPQDVALANEAGNTRLDRRR